MRQDLLLTTLRPEDEAALVARGRDLHWAAWAGGDMVGIGMTMTALAVEELRRRGEEEVRARVHDDNDASLRVFEANGVEEVKRGDGLVILVCGLDAPRRGHGHVENPAGSSIRSAR